MASVLRRFSVQAPAAFPTSTWVPRVTRKKGAVSRAPRTTDAYTPAESARIALLQQELATGVIPTGYKRLHAFTHRGVVTVGPYLRAVINIAHTPWTLDRMLTHAEYNTWAYRAAKRT